MSSHPARLALPTFMSKFEACEAARRILQVDDEADPSVAFLGLVFLYLSWEVEAPSEQSLALLLSQLPAQTEQAASTAHALLRISPTRVSEALKAGVSNAAALQTLNQCYQLSDEVFHGSLTFRELYVRTQAMLMRSPGMGAFLGQSMRGLLQASSPGFRTPSVNALLNGVLAPTKANKAAAGKPAEPLDASVPRMTLFDPKLAAAHLARLAGEEVTPGLRRALQKMAQPGSSERALTRLPDLSGLDALLGRFPHFSAVIEHVRLSLALSATGAGVPYVRIPPILLRGAPGAGKSYFAQELARVLGCAYEERDLSVTSEAFVLTGMDSSWKNAKSGLVFDALFHGPTANPLICLNEVDKTKSSGLNNSPMTSLYTLLEPANARRFKDEFINVPVDASKVIWVLTANDGEIPEPVLSRLEVFDIPTPTFEQCRQIARSVWADLQVTDFPAGHPFPAELTEELCDEVAKLSPRIMRRALTRAAGCAALDKRSELLLEDLRNAQAPYGPQKRAPIGFL